MGIDRTRPIRHDHLPRLFQLIDRLSEQQQLQLLKQLLAGDLKPFLFKSVVDLPPFKQSQILSRLTEEPTDAPPIKTVNIDDDNASMRGHFRKTCLIGVQILTDRKQHQAHILDISTKGLFIETKEPLAVGQRLTVKFTLPNFQDPLELKGHVAWVASNGVGIRLDPIDSIQDDLIRQYVES